jgi:D-alanine-D-alanine ligase
MKNKIRVALLFGGKSAEHEVSLLSAKNVIRAIDREKYEPILIGIDKKGVWRVCDEKKFLLNENDLHKISLLLSEDVVTLVPQDKKSRLLSFSTKQSRDIDVVFPLMHGTYSEDGTIQGLLKLADLPFVGTGILGSAVGMDKDVMKRLLRESGLPIAKFLCFNHKEIISFKEVKDKLGLPLFVKPANLGSSVGVSKVKSIDSFQEATQKAFTYDRKILIEEFIEGREIEVAVIGNDHPVASLPGEAIPQRDEFYTYEAKYLEGGVLFPVPAEMSPELIAKSQRLAIEACKVLCCEGTARVDMFLKKNGDILINEINTMPGFTKTSAYPLLWEGSGVSLTHIVDQLIELALNRYQEEKKLNTSFN